MVNRNGVGNYTPISVLLQSAWKHELLSILANVFQFKEKLYKQTKGLPVGSPASVVLAEITMLHIEKSHKEDY